MKRILAQIPESLRVGIIILAALVVPILGNHIDNRFIRINDDQSTEVIPEPYIIPEKDDEPAVAEAGVVEKRGKELCPTEDEEWEESGKEPENPDSEFSVTADNGKFNLDYFHIYHATTAIIKIFAKDRDYIFDIRQEGIYATLLKGAVTEVNVGSLGMGAHEFKCGNGCKGIVFVDKDLDDYCEE